ncbi:hypothetical protein C8Q79DRAFT_1005080 [Trametes meyenii]|nr:hypothetical protein C8Q79DRAFT_1005080 [Trametes meyenii]
MNVTPSAVHPLTVAVAAEGHNPADKTTLPATSAAGIGLADNLLRTVTPLSDASSNSSPLLGPTIVGMTSVEQQLAPLASDLRDVPNACNDLEEFIPPKSPEGGDDGDSDDDSFIPRGSPTSPSAVKSKPQKPPTLPK